MKEESMGAVIASLRKQHNMTQLELAEQMGVTDKAVSKWERNLSCPDIASLPKLAELFGVSVDDLVGAKTEAEASPQQETTQNQTTLVATICRAVALAMGVAVAALSAMHKLEVQSGLSMLGIGLACIAISLLPSGDNTK